MVNPVDIFTGVFKQLLPLFIVLVAIKISVLLVRAWLKRIKRKQWKSPGFPDANSLSSVSSTVGRVPKPVSLASHNTPSEALSYKQCKPLTATEAIFYYRLVKALPEFLILPQVQLSRFIKIKNESWYKRAGKSYALQNRIGQQSVDYLVCLKDFTIVAAVELDDQSHNNQKVKQLDNKKNESLKAAGVTLIRWHAESMPSSEDIVKIIIPTVER